MMEVEITAELVEQVSRGDLGALQRLLLPLHGHLRTVVTRHLDGPMRRRLEPEDILQDAYIAVFRSVSEARFATVAQFTRWVEAITINTAQNCVRDQHRLKRNVAREVRQSRLAATSYPALIEQLSAQDATPSRLVARNEAAAAVLSSLARLTDDQRTVIKMRFLDGLPVEKVARELSRSEDAIHALTYRALHALREHLGSMSKYLSRA